MKRQGGFTLIELVVVIVILGILAVTAAPRFLNLQTDARQASLEGLRGAMQGASGIVYAKSAIEGYESVATATDRTIDGKTVNIAWGYPTATSTGIEAVVTGLDDDEQWVEVASSGITGGVATNFIYYTLASLTLPTTGTLDNCYVSYSLVPAGTVAQEPTIVVEECD
ncbi:type II secretion system protein [Vibrio algarum]|uniref:Type II secretion system protein n=1 Tax=Vibrio algarum TaxID=3020714 RepID=A0ABT4YMU3_9VIBR|nr:type II secretion system protein [Vibrio sp. KJ40-1]MDB1122872.1 type II secretion system protein [Vibrio sp. KJ40-1]